MENSLKTTKTKKVTETKEEKSYFLVKTKGYSKQFTNEEAARRKFASLEKQKMNAEKPFKIELQVKTGLKGVWVEMDYVEVKDFD